MESHIHSAGRVYNHDVGKAWSVTALTVAEPILASQEVPGGVQVRVDLVKSIPDGLQGGPAGGGRGLLLAPARGGQERRRASRDVHATPSVGTHLAWETH